MDTREHSSSLPGAWPLITVAVGYVMAMLDVTVVNVALHSIRSDLSMTLTGQVWIIDGYTLTFAALLLAGGGLANRYGACAVYVTGLAAFVAASSLCAGATSGADLIGARLLQGAAAALFIPSSLALLARAYPDERERAWILGVWSAIVSASWASGPLVGGLVNRQKREAGRRLQRPGTRPLHHHAHGCHADQCADLPIDAIAMASLLQIDPALLFHGVINSVTPTGSITTVDVPAVRSNSYPSSTVAASRKD